MPRKREKNRLIVPLFEDVKKVKATVDTVDQFPNDYAVINTIRKKSNETVNNSSTLQNDDDFLFRVEPNSIWEVEFVLRFTSATAADFKWAWSVPSGTTFDGVSSRLGGSAAAVADDVFEVVDEAGKGIGSLGAATEAAAWIKGLLVVGTGAGLAQFQWAQSAATASDTVLLANSYMVYRRVS